MGILGGFGDPTWRFRGLSPCGGAVGVSTGVSAEVSVGVSAGVSRGGPGGLPPSVPPMSRAVREVTAQETAAPNPPGPPAAASGGATTPGDAAEGGRVGGLRPPSLCVPPIDPPFPHLLPSSLPTRPFPFSHRHRRHFSTLIPPIPSPDSPPQNKGTTPPYFTLTIWDSHCRTQLHGGSPLPMCPDVLGTPPSMGPVVLGTPPPSMGPHVLGPPPSVTQDFGGPRRPPAAGWRCPHAPIPPSPRDAAL